MALELGVAEQVHRQAAEAELQRVHALTWLAVGLHDPLHEAAAIGGGNAQIVLKELAETNSPRPTAADWPSL